MNRHRQVVTLSIAFDITKMPPPEQWKWGEVGVNLGGAADIKVIASGRVERMETTVVPRTLDTAFNNLRALVARMPSGDNTQELINQVDEIGEVIFSDEFTIACADLERSAAHG